MRKCKMGLQVRNEDRALNGRQLHGSSCNNSSRGLKMEREAGGKGPKRPKALCGIDEDIVCDLTGINARWEVRKKPRTEEINLL